LHIYPCTEEIEVHSGDVSFFKYGKEQKLVPGEHKIKTFSLVLYKNEEDLKRFLELMKTGTDNPEYHRELGKLYGYGEEEISEFIRKSNEQDKHDTKQ